MRRLLLLSSLLAACASKPPPQAPAPLAPAPASAAPAPPRYAAVFDDLAARIERYHVFAPGFARDVGHAWRDDVPALRAEFVRAKDRAEVLIALRHLQSSLRDAHCHLDPPADLQRRRLLLGVELWSGGTKAAPEVRVDKVTAPDAKTAIAVGDAIVSVDGVPITAWIAARPFESARLPPDRALSDTVESIALEKPPWSPVKEGDARVLGILHDGARREVTLHFRRNFPEDEQPDMDYPPPMARVECDAGNPIDYGDYELAAMGVNACVYLPKLPARPRVAVVRYPSFMYGGASGAQSLRMVRVDHDVLARALRDVDGVVLDVHENYGGNNPFILAGWLSGGPWDHERIVTRVVPGLDAATVNELLWGEDDVATYRAAQAAGQATIVTHFLCAPGKCEHVVPDVAERVTQAPVALVTGPNCASSCDSLALTWASFRLGPVVGMQPMHAFTVHRLPVHVKGPESEDLGTFRIALSRSEIHEGTSIEGEPIALDWEAPHTFETRKTWVKQAVSEAKARLVKR